MIQVGTVFESIDFRVKVNCPHRVVAIEFEVSEEEYNATEGPALERFERRAWKQLYKIAGAPPAGYSSWLGGNKFYRV